MRVCLLSMTDSAGQNYLLADAMRKYLGYDAKSFSLAQTYLDYPTDGIISPETISDLQDYASGTDLFVFQDSLFKIPGMRIDKLANPNNTIIYGLGSQMRANINAIMDYIKVGWHVLPPLSDPTIARYIGGAPFEAIIVDPQVFAMRPVINDTITVCHAPTKSVKGEELFAKLMTEVEGVEWLLIKGKTWKEALELKSKAHIMLDSISDESYGLNCLEGIALGQSVISSIAPWCYCLNPNLPIRSIWKQSNNEIVTGLIENRNLWIKWRDNAEYNTFAEEYKNWAENTYSQAVQAQRWQDYIEYVLSS